MGPHTCKKCGQLRKGHVCPFKEGSSLAPVLLDAPPTYDPESYDPMRDPGTALIPAKPRKRERTEDSSDEEEDVPLVARKRPTTAAAARAALASLQHFVDRAEKESNETLTAQLTDVRAQLAERDQEIRELYEQLASHHRAREELSAHYKGREAELKETLAREVDLKNAAVEAERSAIQERNLARDLSRQHEATIEMLKTEGQRQLSAVVSHCATPISLQDLYDRVLNKLQAKYKEGIAVHVTQSPTVTGDVWQIELESGPTPITERAILDWIASVDLSALPEHHVTEYAYSLKDKNGTVHEYDVELLTPTSLMQINRHHRTRRTLTLAPLPPSSASDIAKHMNNFTIPCHDGSSFLFGDEYELSKHVLMEKSSQIPATRAFLELAGAFSSVFTGDITKGPFGDEHRRSWLRADLLYAFLRAACSDPNHHICIVAHGTPHTEAIFASTHGFDLRKSCNGHVGKGVYVASNDYVPRTWTQPPRTHGIASVLFGAFVDSADEYVKRYRMNTGVEVKNEPPDWKNTKVNHAICIPNPQLVGLVPFGAIRVQ